MFSIISVAINAVTSFCINILKAVFSMLLWFIKLFMKALKLFFCTFPITETVFFLLLILNLVIFFTGNSSLLSLFPDVAGLKLISPNRNTALYTADVLKTWWILNVYSYHGQGAYIPLLLLTIIMFIPVVSVFLCISVFSSFGTLIFFAVIADIAIYLLRAVLQKSFVSQFLGRYYFLFPDAGKKHYEKSYSKWLRKHHEEFEEDEDYESEFYEDDEDYDPDYEDEDEDFESDFYEDDDYDPEYEDEDYESDYYEDDEDDDDANDDLLTSKTTFNFFAGCSSRESVEKKYHSLAKLYHPDNMDGDTASLQEINAQYEQAKIKFPR